MGAVPDKKAAKTVFACYQAANTVKATPVQHLLNIWYTTQSKDDIYQIVLKMFLQNLKLRTFSLVTGDTKIIEGNYNEKWWEVLICFGSIESFNPDNCEGQNIALRCLVVCT